MIHYFNNKYIIITVDFVVLLIDCHIRHKPLRYPLGLMFIFGSIIFILYTVSLLF